MSEIIKYILDNPLYCLFLLSVCVIAFGITPYTKEESKYKRRALVDKKYNDTFKK